jgi:CheY-like chemotaxis protein
VIQLRDVLLREGYEVLIASSGSEALQIIAERIPDVMILDLMMPEIDGFEVLRIIRSQERTTTLPVLILTAKQITKEELAFLKGNNVKQLIQKGDVSIKELLTAVSNMFGDLPASYEGPAAEPKKWDQERKPRVLVIEDNPDNMTTVAALLSDSCVLLQAYDGQTGLHLVRNAHPDIVLCDISLPGLDGFTVLEYIRQDPAIRDLPIVALTARAMQSDVDEILAHGFDAYISKPVDAQILEQQIFGILDGIV